MKKQCCNKSSAVTETINVQKGLTIIKDNISFSFVFLQIPDLFHL